NVSAIGKTAAGEIPVEFEPCAFGGEAHPHAFVELLLLRFSLAQLVVVTRGLPSFDGFSACLLNCCFLLVECIRHFGKMLDTRAKIFLICSEVSSIVGECLIT